MIEKIENYILYILNFRTINKIADTLVRLSNIEELTDEKLERFLLEERIEDMLKHE